jgi:hypothetical protein
MNQEIKEFCSYKSKNKMKIYKFRSISYEHSSFVITILKIVINNERVDIQQYKQLFFPSSINTLI